MRRALLFIVALFAFMPGVASANDDSLTFKFRSYDKSVVDLEFYSQNRRYVWPGKGEVYVIRDYEVKNYTIKCMSGEKICYGAWVRGNSRNYWGAGRDNKQSCKGCCYTCGDGDTPVINLNAR